MLSKKKKKKMFFCGKGDNSKTLKGAISKIQLAMN
jgi:hypothetical protein